MTSGPTAAYQVADPTTRKVTESHAIIYGQCPVCKVYWSQRPDKSCGCFSPDPPADPDRAWLMHVRRVVMQVMQENDVLIGGEAD